MSQYVPAACHFLEVLLVRYKRLERPQDDDTELRLVTFGLFVGDSPKVWFHDLKKAYGEWY